MSEASSRDRDRECLRRLAEGDIGALETLWRTHGDRAFRHALWVTGRRDDAEDIVQSVFARVAGMGAELLGVRDLVAYLGAMVHRESIDVVRRARRDRSVEVEPDELLATEADPEADADRRKAAALVATLPEDQREAVVLHLWGGLTFREIGRAAGVSTFTIASRYRLALSRLRRALGGDRP